MRLRATLLAALAFAAAASRAEAADTIVFTLQSTTGKATAGGAVSFSATVAAPATNAATVYLNGLAYNISPMNGFTIDDDAFFYDYPLSLDAGQRYSGPLFTLLVPAGSATGLYSATVALLGGPSDASQDIITTQGYSVAVAAAATAVPEPATWALMTLGIGAAGGALRRGRRRAALAA